MIQAMLQRYLMKEAFRKKILEEWCSKYEEKQYSEITLNKPMPILNLVSEVQANYLMQQANYEEVQQKNQYQVQIDDKDFFQRNMIEQSSQDQTEKISKPYFYFCCDRSGKNKYPKKLVSDLSISSQEHISFASLFSNNFKENEKRIRIKKFAQKINYLRTSTNPSEVIKNRVTSIMTKNNWGHQFQVKQNNDCNSLKNSVVQSQKLTKINKTHQLSQILTSNPQIKYIRKQQLELTSTQKSTPYLNFPKQKQLLQSGLPSQEYGIIRKNRYLSALKRLSNTNSDNNLIHDKESMFITTIPKLQKSQTLNKNNLLLRKIY
eukprot:TRINITY_DN2634_c0_g4_i1.p1 TRINITY_DN2634_c0_g4~~TRINITY_DN2634_c0_g4_i1.p1  ORF type:complete len:320 (-),score=38.12 TRINITY_DN2634_c0_g4_i1:77-1036(-)